MKFTIMKQSGYKAIIAISLKKMHPIKCVCMEFKVRIVKECPVRELHICACARARTHTHTHTSKYILYIEIILSSLHGQFVKGSFPNDFNKLIPNIYHLNDIWYQATPKLVDRFHCLRYALIRPV